VVVGANQISYQENSIVLQSIFSFTRMRQSLYKDLSKTYELLNITSLISLSIYIDDGLSIDNMCDEWKVSRYSQLCAKVSRCSQLCYR
jgi:hypothetical protein